MVTLFSDKYFQTSVFVYEYSFSNYFDVELFFCQFNTLESSIIAMSFQNVVDRSIVL
jgi:hypothetical protein